MCGTVNGVINLLRSSSKNLLSIAIITVKPRLDYKALSTHSNALYKHVQYVKSLPLQESRTTLSDWCVELLPH